MPELRQDPIRGHWVIIAPERGRRTPSAVHVGAKRSDHLCPFCPGSENVLTQIIHELAPDRPASGEPNWLIRVVPNRVPALKVEESLKRSGEGIFDRISGVGAHEIVIESPQHEAHWADMSAGHLEKILQIWRERMLDLTRDVRLRYMQVVKNYGYLTGATVSHPHSQILALPLIPPAIDSQLQAASAHYSAKQRCLFCDLLDQELNDNDRVVTVNEDFAVISPFAARSPFELLILPRKHEHDFKTADSRRMRNLANILKDILFRLRRGLDNPAFSLVLNSSPNRRTDVGAFTNYPLLEKAWHWHLTLIPYPPLMTGFEMGTGCYINPTAPEEAAAFLRGIIPETAR